jgi:MFS transporter, DHA1 family, tetracycline resistance protein
MVSLKQRLSGKAMPVVLVTIFIDVLGVAILIPVLPQLIYAIFMPAGYDLGGALIVLGWLTACYPLVQFAATPVLGQLSDRFGRKPVLAISLFGTALGYVIFAIGVVTKNISLLFVGRVLDGLTGGNVSVARAVIADVTEPKNRARNFGLIGACFGVGFVIGPYIGARLAEPNAHLYGLFTTPHWFSSATPFWFAAVLSVLNMLSVMIILPETHQHIDKQLRLTWNKSVDNIRQAIANPRLRVLFSAEFLFWSGFTFFTTFFQILLIQKLGFNVSNAGDFFAYLGLWIAIAQVIIVPFAGKYLKSHQILRFSLFGNGVALLLLLIPTSGLQLYMVGPFIAIFIGLTMANSSALVSLTASKKNQGEVLGIEASVQALAQAIPAIIAGYVATFGVATPVIVGGIVMIAGGCIFNLFYHVPKNVNAKEAAHIPPAV